jgi:hypothetical protein
MKRYLLALLGVVVAIAIGAGLALGHHSTGLTAAPTASRVAQTTRPTVVAQTTSPAVLPSLAVTTPAAPAPVSTEATLAGQCVTGIDDLTSQSFYPMSGMIGSSPSSPPSGDQVAEGYQMTLTNNGSTAAQVSGFSAVFYDGQGSETTSDTETFDSATFLEPGQSLTWTEYPWGEYTNEQGTASVGPYAGGVEGAYDVSATCQIAQWTHP